MCKKSVKIYAQPHTLEGRLASRVHTCIQTIYPPDLLPAFEPIGADAIICHFKSWTFFFPSSSPFSLSLQKMWLMYN